MFKVISREIKQIDAYQEIIDSNEFYFEKLTKQYGEYKDFKMVGFKKKLEDFISNQPKSFKFQNLLNNNTANKSFHDFLILIGKMIAVFDEKGYKGENRDWNPYKDKRVIAHPMLTQNNWTYGLFKYKLNNFNFEGLEEKRFNAFRYTIGFIEKPEEKVNITSPNHRQQIIEYFKLNDEREIINLFREYTVKIKNKRNVGVLVAHILYTPEIKKLWNIESYPIPDIETEEYKEGKIWEEIKKHKRRERNLKLVSDYKKRHSEVEMCPGCSMKPQRVYNINAIKLLELHHIVPLSTKSSESKINFKDLTLLCPSCHRAIHKMMIEDDHKIISLNEFRTRIKNYE